MKKRIFFAIAILILLAGALTGIKVLQIRRLVQQGAAYTPPPTKVTAATAQKATWETLLNAVGTLEAMQGVTVAAELPGKVTRLAFQSGDAIQRGDLLVRLDTSSEQAQLPGAEAEVTLARLNLQRSDRLLAEHIISPAEHDQAVADYRSARAAADAIRATIGKKTVRAPFAGRLGIRQVDLGQMLSDGQAIVTLQQLDPIHVNFLLPQQQLAGLHAGLPVRVTADTLPDQTLEGTINAINPEVDSATRNVRIQAILKNPGEQLRPGMFVNVAVVLPTKEPVLTIPATAILYAPYSDSVFVIEDQKDEQSGEIQKIIRQQLVRLGTRKGDFVAVTSGLEEGQAVVTTGVFKLRNGQSVIVDNSLSPQFKTAPTPENN
ncbi:efflux pump, RND family, membrane fusion protein [Syntrophotalea carbinolica DSM 2380]|uniref:Efflux pump, RND family, membrane fusion protein n=1 Tax=Syntrophotalea carbinolica (strain DSM 2380 / NBRC 103641 / GraBd1) TaxID=338963 RepID=Q3A2C5_SYNC1|nr:efflux RND transporter periplasmic adaptor subunit [Syntrophotalea carbinolica]ABA89482.1 efflux pump, RND family, membrane fusion protein [Syntrophotalea carbinolica DSM 2380]